MKTFLVRTFIASIIIACAALAFGSIGCSDSGTAWNPNADASPDETTTPPPSTPTPVTTTTIPSAEYWVSTDGSDANPGTEQLPFLTLKKAADMASEKAKDINVMPGTYMEIAPIIVGNGVSIRGTGNLTIDPLLYRPVIDFSDCAEDTCGIGIEKSTTDFETEIDGLVIKGKHVGISILDASPTITNNDITTVGDETSNTPEIGISISACEPGSTVAPLIEDNAVSTGDNGETDGQAIGIIAQTLKEDTALAPRIIDNEISSGDASLISLAISASASAGSNLDLIVRSNDISAGSSNRASEGMAIIDADSAVVEQNTIIAGAIALEAAEANARTEGVSVGTKDASKMTQLTFHNNFVYGGTDARWARGVFAYGSVYADIAFNSIHAGQGTNDTSATAALFDDDVQAFLKNNIFCTGTSMVNYGIYEINPNVQVLENNLFCDDLGIFYVSYDGMNTQSYTDVATINALGALFDNNIDGDPGFFDEPNHDYRITSLSDAIDGGVLISGIDVDIEDNARLRGTAPDIGAYELK